MKKLNFFAGPAILAQEVIEKASKALINFDDMGLSIMEISHRSPQFTAVINEARTSVKELLNVPDDYEVLFLSGGASSQFFMTAMNLLNDDEQAGYINTGAWSKKAIKEAKYFGDIKIVASSEDKNFSYIPKGYAIDNDLKYVHLTTNNTIYGTQFHDIPETNVPLVADMSSDIFSRPIDISKFHVIYAGAQKNLGPAGTTLVIVKRDIVNKVNRKLPSMLNYDTHIQKDSMFHTPPVFPIYVSMLSLRWMKEQGGIPAIQKRNVEKANMLYEEIDRNRLFHGNVAKEDRSLMNVCFTATHEEDNESFIKYAEDNNCVGIKGHRSVGGFRASIYNAMPIEGVKKLVEVMQAYGATK